MLRLAVDAGYPSIRQWLARDGGASALEHRELVDLLAIEPIGNERLDWHFARLSSLLVSLWAKQDDGNALTMTDFLLEYAIAPAPDEDDDEDEASRTAFLTALAARIGVPVERVHINQPSPEEE